MRRHRGRQKRRIEHRPPVCLGRMRQNRTARGKPAGFQFSDRSHRIRRFGCQTCCGTPERRRFRRKNSPVERRRNPATRRNDSDYPKRQRSGSDYEFLCGHCSLQPPVEEGFGPSGNSLSGNRKALYTFGCFQGNL
ncbi:MAG: hypothetical protein BWX77_01220 [Bacteroidetes bacterium ADurb.Bin090]|nr:MAG: hypothetical protein BWX77_01220 [Bacteroidetes bacterium ADurb.Bin090]